MGRAHVGAMTFDGFPFQGSRSSARWLLLSRTSLPAALIGAMMFRHTQLAALVGAVIRSADGYVALVAWPVVGALSGAMALVTRSPYLAALMPA